MFRHEIVAQDVAANNESSIVFLDGSVRAIKDLVGQVRPETCGIRRWRPNQHVSFKLPILEQG